MPHDRVEITCVSPELRKIIQEELDDIADPDERDEAIRLLGELRDCSSGKVLEFETPHRDPA